MKKVINIDGIAYIQKAEYDKAKKDVDTIKKMVASSIVDLSDFLNNQSTAQPKDEKEYYSKRNSSLKIRQLGQRLYKISYMDDKGRLFSVSGRKIKFTIKDVMAIQKIYNSKTTKADTVQMSKQFNLSVDIIHRIIYNIDYNIFDEYIKKYLSSVNDIKIKKKEIETQNNPEKRKESGIYS